MFKKVIFLFSILLLATNTMAKQNENEHNGYNTSSPSPLLINQVNLTMNDVPIMDQGIHGSCAIFAVTSALDALMYEGDHMSQLCLLALGSTLEKNDKQVLSGWDGASGIEVFDRIKQYGYIKKSDEASIRCGGLEQYPTYDNNTGKPMRAKRYQKYSHSLDKNITIRLIDHRSLNQVVENIKEELELGNRVVVNLFVDPLSYDMGFAESYGDTLWGDTLAITDSLKIDLLRGHIEDFPRHYMVIYGYDDAANINGQHGVFMLRNSWGKSWGYRGDGYVTYDYLKLMYAVGFAVVRD